MGKLKNSFTYFTSLLTYLLTSRWAGEIVTPPASANMRPFKTAVAAVDMNLGSGWKQTAVGGVGGQKKSPSLHFDARGRQRTYVRFEEVGDLSMTTMLMRSPFQTRLASRSVMRALNLGVRWGMIHSRGSPLKRRRSSPNHPLCISTASL